MNPLDSISLNFSEESLWLLNICIGVIMFGVALELSFSDFLRLFKNPKSALTGLFSQFVVLPALTFVLVYFWQPAPSVALGMMLVAACPGGNVSNFISLTAKGNAALSVSLTAFATVLTLVFTPLNFTFWASQYAPAAEMLTNIQINPLKIAEAVVVLLGIPLVLGMLIAARLPKLTERIKKPIRIASMVIFTAFLVVALMKNFALFREYIHLIFFLVLLHNAIAFISGYSLAKILKRPEADARSIAIETGIQNSALGLTLIFNFFDGLGGMAFIAAWWGIWHLVAGMGLAMVWRRG